MALTTLLAFVAFFFGFSFLIFIHELGHFVVARWAGIKCTQFAIGMGQAICSWRKGIGLRAGGTEREYERLIRERLHGEGIEPREVDGEERFDATDIDRAARELGLGETEYRLNWMPLGGYVKMLGQEDLDPAARSNDPRSFNAKSVGARMAVISAGVIMNLVFGMILLTAAFLIGVRFPTTTAAGAAPYSPAWSAYAQGHEGDPEFLGIQPGDHVLSLNGKPLKDFLDLKLGVALSRADESLRLAVQRAGRDQPLQFVVTPATGPDGLLSIGIQPMFTLEKVALPEHVLPENWREVASAMRLTAVDGQAVGDYLDFRRVMLDEPTRAREVAFVDDKSGYQTTLTVAPRPMLQQTELSVPERHTVRHLLGMRPAVRIQGDPVKGSPAEAAGLRDGDLIARLGETAWPAPEQVSHLVRDAGGRPLDVAVLRDGERVELGPVTPRRNRIGIYPAPAFDAPIVAQVLAGSAASGLNLPAGSRLRAIGARAIEGWSDLQLALGEAEPGPLAVTVELNVAGRPTEQATLMLDAEQRSEIQRVGWQPESGFLLQLLEKPVKAEGMVAAAGLGLQRTGDFMMQAYLMIARLAQGTVGAEHLAGPVGIVHAGTRLTRKGAAYWLFFLGLLSVNLAVINFLPIPIVDGGHAVFLIVEKLKGSPVSANVQAAATYVGLAFIGLVFIVVTYYDIVRLVTP